jgi:hypothetical protein
MELNNSVKELIRFFEEKLLIIPKDRLLPDKNVNVRQNIDLYIQDNFYDNLLHQIDTCLLK